MKDYFKKLKYLFRWRDVLFALFLIGLIVCLGLCRAQDLIEVTMTDTDVTIVTDRYTMNIPYDMIEAVEIAPIDKDDEELGGIGDITLRTGPWENGDWGEYYACVDMQTKTCVKVLLEDGRIFVFSAHSDKYVQECYDALVQHMD